MEGRSVMPIVDESYMKEFFFEVDGFRQGASVSGRMALAQRLQTLMIMEPGTIPTAPDCGVGIGLFRFEFADAPTIAKIQTRILDQVERFIPESGISDAIVETVSPDNRNKVLAVKFTLDTEHPLDNGILMVFARAPGDAKGIVSKVIT
jgi:hypothetical protein